MTTTAMLAVQTAIYQRLSTDAALNLMCNGVFDYVPEGTPYPYVIIGDATEISDDLLVERGKELAVSFHVWSAAEGNTEALTIIKRLDELLDEQTLTVVGWDAWRCKNEFVEVLRENDEGKIYRHGVPRYRVQLTES